MQEQEPEVKYHLPLEWETTQPPGDDTIRMLAGAIDENSPEAKKAAEEIAQSFAELAVQHLGYH